MLTELCEKYSGIDCGDLGTRQLEQLSSGLKQILPEEITSAQQGRAYIDLLRKFREAVAENDKLHGANYPKLLKSLLSVGEDGLYSNNLRFIFELIQNVDDCDYPSDDDRHLDIEFDFNKGLIILTYNEVGFTPFNVFAITGTAEAAKNVSASKTEIGEKGIGFKSVFGVADRVHICSGWFSFELRRDNFSIPISLYSKQEFCRGTRMTLYVGKKARDIYDQIRDQYCRKDALFSKNPLLFLNKLTYLRFYNDESWRYMEFRVSRRNLLSEHGIQCEKEVIISVDYHDYNQGLENSCQETISCVRYTYPVVYSKEACVSRYGENTNLGSNGGKRMSLQVVIPYPNDVDSVGHGGLYSFLPTQIRFTVPIVCNVPFKLDASREFVDPQGENLWFRESCSFLSELLEHVYSDLSRIVRENIVWYIPGSKESLYAPNNGKEECLSKQQCFMGERFLSLPLFCDVDGVYRRNTEVFCFDQEDHITDPERIYRLFRFKKALFIPPIEVSVKKFGISVQSRIHDVLFKKALADENGTEAMLEFLDSDGYRYTIDVLVNALPIKLTSRQIESIMRHKNAAAVLKEFASKCIINNKQIQITIISSVESRIGNVLYEDFDVDETPQRVAHYLEHIARKRCAILNIGENDYLPCSNVLILSSNNTLNSFAEFCRSIDDRDTFTVRLRLRELSQRLTDYVERGTGTAEEYLDFLRNNRQLVKESLGKKGYERYFDLILRSGTDNRRFIHELLQNADDCEYPHDVTPTFTIKIYGTTIETDYNESGFTREDIRSITALGESTKNEILTRSDTIGEKGIGFKAIFIVAGRVKIYSGEYCFSLSEKEPTIPRRIELMATHDRGTHMVIELKKPISDWSFKDTDLIQLCLCLRNLRCLDLFGKKVTITDDEEHRTITIGNKEYIFRKFVYVFHIDNDQAIKERENGSYRVTAEQRIICYIPEKNPLKEYHVYNGLPTSHILKIPMAIDAPFALTTSREMIDESCKLWNGIIREKMYEAIIKVMEELKHKERLSVLRFTRFIHRRRGFTDCYDNGIAGDDTNFLNNYSFTQILSETSILPTLAIETFSSVAAGVSFRYPLFVNLLFKNYYNDGFSGVDGSTIVDEPSDRYDVALKALGVKQAEYYKVMLIISQCVEIHITEREISDSLYQYLYEVSGRLNDEQREKLKRLSIIPVINPANGNKGFISWQNDKIFLRSDASGVNADYYLLDTELLSKEYCEAIFGVHINEMNAEWEHNRYRLQLTEIITTAVDLLELYVYLLNEFNSGNIRNHNAGGLLLEHKSLIPLRNQLGDIVYSEAVYACDQVEGYFDTHMIKQMASHKTCEDFARFLRCAELSGIHYDDIDYQEKLTADDIEVLMDSYFINSDEIIRGFYEDRLIPEDLIETYNLGYLRMGRSIDSEYDDYDFPEETLKDLASLRRHIAVVRRDAPQIVSVTESRTIQKFRKPDGTELSFNSYEARISTLSRYSPTGWNDRCFCQMCGKVKRYSFIEVNSIMLEPDFFYPQLRIALCLECSKRFEEYRRNDTFQNDFLQAIRAADVSELTYHGTVSIPIRGEYIKFTSTHLAEIQEILNNIEQ